MIEQEDTPCIHLTSGNNHKTGCVVPGKFCSPIQIRYYLQLKTGKWRCFEEPTNKGVYPGSNADTHLRRGYLWWNHWNDRTKMRDNLWIFWCQYYAYGCWYEKWTLKCWSSWKAEFGILSSFPVTSGTCRLSSIWMFPGKLKWNALGPGMVRVMILHRFTQSCKFESFRRLSFPYLAISPWPRCLQNCYTFGAQ